MPEPLKNYYNKDLIEKVSFVLKNVYPSFDKSKFVNLIFDTEWDNRELKQRMRHLSLCIKDTLTGNYKKDVAIILKMVDEIEISESITDGVQLMFIPDYLEVFGVDDYETSISAIERITQLTTCEFAIRPFIIRYPKETIKQMMAWTKHSHPMVRRLATEGIRPRLPWATALPSLKKDPSPIFPILEALKTDSSESVRRSVANNLNDISKDHPETVIAIANKWKGKSYKVDAIIKHGCRSLLKQGDQRVLELIGYGSHKNVITDQLEVQTPKVKIGDYLSFSFRLKNNNPNPVDLRLEYGIYYLKANGTHSKKVFKISEKSYEANSEMIISRRQSFKVITTRLFHRGKHYVSVIVNGKEGEKEEFLLG